MPDTDGLSVKTFGGQLTTVLILGIESSCDETAVALVRDGREIVVSLVSSQIKLHAPYGGVVPEVACRAHAEWLPPLIAEAMTKARLRLADVDAVAATAQPGLIGALLIGLTAGKALAWALEKPFVAVDHIDGHLHAPRMVHAELPYPHLALVVSGGHTEIYRCDGPLRRDLLAQTADDAAGECFDKAAALLGLGYPGGPNIERVARGGNPAAVRFSRGKPGDDGMAISFSGLKTAVLYHLRERGYAIHAGRPRLSGPSTEKSADARGSEVEAAPTKTLEDARERADIAASFQEAAVDMLIRPALEACRVTGIDDLTLTGGVACNARLREKLALEASARGVRVYPCPKELCTDNAAFIAGAAHAKASVGLFDPLTVDALPN